jgi:OmpA-OmpF porin, OOP family
MKFMKKDILVIIFTFLCLSNVYTQTRTKNWGVIFDYGTLQYQGEIANQFGKFSQWQSGYGLGGSYYLSPSFNIGGGVAYYFLNTNPLNDNPFWMKGYLYPVLAHVEYKFANGYLIKEESIWQPYLKIAYGSVFGKTWGMSLDLNGAPYEYFVNESSLKTIVGLKAQPLDQWAFHFEFGNYLTSAVAMDGAKSAPNKDMLYAFSLGATFLFGNLKDSDNDGVPNKFDMCPLTPPNVTVDGNGCPIDSDNDGIPDYLDFCPNEFGTIKTMGCPDQDEDGVADNEDECPNVPGEKLNRGCPLNRDESTSIEFPLAEIPKSDVNIFFVSPPQGQGAPLVYSSATKDGIAFDRDSDGIADPIDQCPDLKGTVENFGCPEDSLIKQRPNNQLFSPQSFHPLALTPGCPNDKDCDGIADEFDNCPDIPGDIKNKGCPINTSKALWRDDIKVAPVHFATGATYITDFSKDRLEKLVQALNQNPNLNVWIFGHTDARGGSEVNKAISEKRVGIIVDFLISKGIASNRIFSIGFGENFPISFGREDQDLLRNRRVEFFLFEY